MFQDRPLSEFLDRVELHVEAINTALAEIPRDRVRLHVCFGNWDGPHIDDIELGPVLPLIYKAKVGGLSLSCANPRHQHEYKAIRKHRPPTEMAVLPGVIDVTTNYLEHPEVVADRILPMGRCGRGSGAHYREHRLRVRIVCEFRFCC